MEDEVKKDDFFGKLEINFLQTTKIPQNEYEFDISNVINPDETSFSFVKDICNLKSKTELMKKNTNRTTCVGSRRRFISERIRYDR